MQIFVAGATGVLGRRVVAELVDRGHNVTGLVRDDAGEAVVEDRGGDTIRGDLLEPETLSEGIGRVDVVVHAATAIPNEVRTSDDDWEATERLRTEGTRTLFDLAIEASADRFLYQSVTWVARQPDGSHFDEDSQAHDTLSTRSAFAGERIARERAEDHDVDLGVLRCGMFYSHDAGHTRLYGEQLLDGFFPIIGTGLLGRRDAELSYCHVDNAALAFAAVAEADATGTWHVVDDETATWAAFVGVLAERLDRDPPRRVPAWLAKRLVGRQGVELLTREAPTSNEKLRREVDWEPAVSTFREGLDRVVDRWEADGIVRPTDDGYEWMGE